jgi:5-methylcytosine-specific restriction endonuclease McrA
MGHWNTKKRLDDKRGYKVWTEESKRKVSAYFTQYTLLQDEQWLREQYLNQKRSTVSIAKELGCVNSTVFLALNRFHIPRRSCKQACKSGPEHHLWRGGTGFRSDARYEEWRLMVYGRDNYTCQMCGQRGVYFNAHHILPCRDFPDLIYSVDNGVTLCEPCHRKTYNCEKDYADNLKSLVKKNPNSVEPRTGNTEPSIVSNGEGVCRDYGDSPKGMI